jgi:DNA-binding transcriptional LysR family regulator
MTTGPLRMQPVGTLADLQALPSPLLDVTLDQLRTLIAVQEAGSPLRASALLGREHSSVRKQLDTLNRIFQHACGEAAVVKQGRGQDYLFTPTGEMAASVARGMFSDWLAGITDRRRRLGAAITVATTEFTVDFLAQVWPQVEGEFTRREIELNIVHVRTRDFRAQLDAKNVDLICGSIPASPGPDPALDAYDVIEWQREDLALITNLPARELPADAISQQRLPAVPLLAPSAGLIADFLRRWYGNDFRSQLRIIAEIDSIYYGLALLRSRLVHGALVATSATARAAIEGRLPGGPGLRLIRLEPAFSPPLQILAGIFARKGERGLYHHEHPLNLLWNAFQARAHEMRKELSGKCCENYIAGHCIQGAPSCPPARPHARFQPATGFQHARHGSTATGSPACATPIRST